MKKIKQTPIAVQLKSDKSYFNLNLDDDDDYEDYKSKRGQEILGEFTSMFKGFLMADKRKKAAKAAKLAKDKMACNKPKKTPGHPTKSHVVKACKDGEEKIVRFGQQGVKGAGKNPKTAKEKARRKSYYARHNAQDSKPDKFSARYWSHKVKW